MKKIYPGGKTFKENEKKKAAKPVLFRVFAEKNDLTLEVHFRTESYLRHLPPVYVHFSGVEVAEGKMLESTFGDGKTEKEAIQDYARQLSGKTIQFEQNGCRIRIPVPILKA